MKKALFGCLAICAAIFLIVQKSAKGNFSLSEHEMYLTNHEFYFISSFEKDPSFLQRIYSMLDQEYENYHIYLYIDPFKISVVNKLKTYAKKLSKEHFLTIIEKVDDKPFALVKEEILQTLSPQSVVIDLSTNCVFSENDMLTTMNTIFKTTPMPISLYSNFLQAPTYKINTNLLTYKNSALKATYVKDLLNKKPSKSFYLDKVLYIKEEKSM